MAKYKHLKCTVLVVTFFWHFFILYCAGSFKKWKKPGSRDLWEALATRKLCDILGEGKLFTKKQKKTNKEKTLNCFLSAAESWASRLPVTRANHQKQNQHKIDETKDIFDWHPYPDLLSLPKGNSDYEFSVFPSRSFFRNTHTQTHIQTQNKWSYFMCF